MIHELLSNIAKSTVQSSSHRKQSNTRKSRNRRLYLENLESRHLLATLVVDDDLADCKKADFTSIQAAVDVAQPGDKVEVCEGTYEEQVNIPATKDGLELRAKKKMEAVIQAPDAMTQTGIVQVDGAQDVTIRGFTIKGPFTDLSARRAGIFVGGDGSAKIEDNHVTAIRAEPMNGAQFGIGIQVGSTFLGQSGSADIRKNLIDDYQKGGIVIDNDSSAVIDKNEIIGAGPTTLLAQNGIQISGDSTAEIRKNHVTGNDFTNPGTAAGILVDSNTSEVTIEKNEVEGNEGGIVGQNASDIAILHNDVFDNSGTGISLSSVTLSLIAHNKVRNNGRHGINLQIGSNDNEILHNKVEQNAGAGIRLSASNDNRVSKNHSSKNGENGIQVVNGSSNNEITDNKLQDNVGDDAFDNTVGTGTAGTANFWEGNKGETENRPGLLED
jgi:parallel beta-helix repeat protein